MKLRYETPSLEEVMIVGSVITESLGTLIPGAEIIGGEEVDW